MPIGHFPRFNALVRGGIAADLDRAEILMWMAYETFAGPDGVAYPDGSTLARILGHENTNHISRLRRSLERKGLLEIIDSGGGRGNPCRVRMLTPIIPPLQGDLFPELNTPVGGSVCDQLNTPISEGKHSQIDQLNTPISEGKHSQIERAHNKDEQPIEQPIEQPNNSPGKSGSVGFDLFWKSWPAHERKCDRKACLKFWSTNRLDENPDIIPALDAWKGSETWARSGGQYVPAPLVWLHQSRWEATPSINGNGATNGKQRYAPEPGRIPETLTV